MASAHNSKCCAYAARAVAQKWAVSRERYEHTQAHTRTQTYTHTSIVHTHKYLNSKSSKLEYGSNSITSSGKCDREKKSERVRESAHKQLRQHPLPHTHSTIACMRVCVCASLIVCETRLPARCASRDSRARSVRPTGSSFARSFARSFASLHLVLAPSSSASPFQLETANHNNSSNNNKLATTFWRPAASLVLS